MRPKWNDTAINIFIVKSRLPKTKAPSPIHGDRDDWFFFGEWVNRWSGYCRLVIDSRWRQLYGVSWSGALSTSLTGNDRQVDCWAFIHSDFFLSLLFTCDHSRSLEILKYWTLLDKPICRRRLLYCCYCALSMLSPTATENPSLRCKGDERYDHVNPRSHTLVEYFCVFYYNCEWL